MNTLKHSRYAATLFCLAAFGATTSIAHHSTAMYDADKTVELEGTLKKAQLSNPHSWFFVVITNAQGAQETWALEGSGVAETDRRVGGNAKEYFAVGQKVKVAFHPVRDGRSSGELITMKFGDGRVFGSQPQNPPGGGAPPER